MAPPRTARHIAPISLAAACALAACAGPGTWGSTRPLTPTTGLRADHNAFAPVAIRVHPLTHLASGLAEPAIICHIEMTDRWGDPVKALGILQLQLYRPQGGLNASTAEQILLWDAPLQDERYNASVYDPATRTYRLQLAGLPQWISRAADDQNRDRIEIRAVFQTLGPGGEEQVLRDGRIIEF